MNEFTFLTHWQIFDSKEKLKIFKRKTATAVVSDFAILLGADFYNITRTVNGKKLKMRTGCYWTKTSVDYFMGYVNHSGEFNFRKLQDRLTGARPAVLYSSIQDFVTKKRVNEQGLIEVEYGEYPQDAVPLARQLELERLYQTNFLNTTGKSYTTDSQECNKYNLAFKPLSHPEYEYNGQKYVRVKANSCYFNEYFTLANGGAYHNGDYIWIKVQPIKWLVDQQADIALAKNILFAGVQFKNNSYLGRLLCHKFSGSDIESFMRDSFSKDIIPSTTLIIKEKNPYNFIFESVSEEDIIKGAIESNVAVFLHGSSGDGKSARVRQLDPNCEIIHLINATPESLNGKSVYDASTNKMSNIKPAWLEKIEQKCQAEPNRLHIVFFDELTNALPSIQGMTFNIFLDKEVNGIWKLPKNCRLVAAGNELSDSLVANELAELLFNRFAHVYINTTVESWLKWAATPKGTYETLEYNQELEPEFPIHPAIYSFIACCGEKILRSKYNGERPNADPRKWEMASKVLYKTKNPEMLRALVGEEITRDFIKFCQKQVITLEDIINDNYSLTDLELNQAEKYTTVVYLSQVAEEHLEKVRGFVTNFEPEFIDLFDNLWIHGDAERLERIAELRASSLVKKKVKK